MISVRAPVGPTNVADQRCCIGRGLAALRPFGGVDREYLLLTLKALEIDLSSKGYGTTFSAITKKHIWSPSRFARFDCTLTTYLGCGHISGF